MISKETLKIISSLTSMEVCKAAEYMLEEKYGKVPEIDKIWLSIIRKDLQILEIIKNKLVFPLALMSLPYELYNKSVMKEQQLTQEEYDKIKEWLENEIN